jgi:hypothetical protein
MLWCLSRLTSFLVLFLTGPWWAAGSGQLTPSLRVDPSPSSACELRLAGELRFYRHIDPVTGQGAVSLQADKEEIPLDFRQFPMDILLRSGPYVIKGHWGKQQRLVVTEAHPSPSYSHRCGNEITATEPSPDRAPDCR